MLFCALVASLAYLAWLLLSLQLTDPMWFGLSRRRHIWFTGLTLAMLSATFTHDAIEKHRTLHLFTRIGEKLTPNAEIKSECEIWLDTVWSTAFGEPIKL